MRPRRRAPEPARPVIQQARINDAIRAPRVRLVDEDGAQIGIKATKEAIDYAFSKNLDLVERVEEIAKEKRSTPSALALAWVMAQGNDIVPIPGTKRRKYLEENVAALDLQLSPEDLARIHAAFPPDAAAGNRYPAHMIAMLDR